MPVITDKGERPIREIMARVFTRAWQELLPACSPAAGGCAAGEYKPDYRTL
jgi:hypothetical protein